MSECDFENKVQTLKVELMAGQTDQAAQLLRSELYYNPQEAQALINCARQPGTPDEIVFGANGSVVLRDNINRFDQNVGQLPCGPQPYQPVQYEPQYGPQQYGPQQPCGPQAYRPVQVEHQPCAPRVVVEPPCHPEPRFERGQPHRREEIDVRFGGGVNIEFGNVYHGHDNRHRR